MIRELVPMGFFVVIIEEYLYAFMSTVDS